MDIACRAELKYYTQVKVLAICLNVTQVQLQLLAKMYQDKSERCWYNLKHFGNYVWCLLNVTVKLVDSMYSSLSI